MSTIDHIDLIDELSAIAAKLRVAELAVDSPTFSTGDESAVFGLSEIIGEAIKKVETLHSRLEAEHEAAQP